MSALVAGVFVSSLAGSVHCAGMCGPLVPAYAAGPADRLSGRRRALAHACHAAGRLAAYVTLGALAGGMGRAIDLVGGGAGVARAAEIVAGMLVTLWGVH
ncbi:MAG TPA: sulfite exporter TauE/SafE family protein, partial [Candidatus Polarisedimenticolaceae bacterium]|nr:sulfite exporter TauE/SafE family protein [Candidatus Polarisedimenticolaceae bacterium]